jgi:hypothetical protein
MAGPTRGGDAPAAAAALAARVEELEARLRRVEDVEAIRRLKARYGDLADRRYDPRGPLPRSALEPIARELAGLFTEDAEWDGGPSLGRCRGRQAIYERFLAPTLRFSWHYFVKPRIEVDGDAARGRWDVLAPCTAADGRPFWMAGVEDDEYRRVDGVWLHRRMALEVVFFAPHARGWDRGAP